MSRRLTVLALVANAGLAPLAAAADYLRDVKPVFKERCYACHGALKQKAGLRLDTAEHIHAGGDDGEVLSKLLDRVTHQDAEQRMPPEGKALDDATVVALRAWLAAGAPIPEGEAADDDPKAHWAFQPLERPAVPEGEFANPVDAFLEAERRKSGLAAQGRTHRSIALRRLYLDLLGLPPTREQLADSRQWPEIVDELLASQQYGERWARHWMDVWRYSDWYGLGAQLRNSQKHLWHWRDWIIDSLNADKGYDRMVLEMLAGDEIAPDDPEVVRATGFLARNYYLFNRTTWLDSTIEHTGKAFLGLTLNCAKCHDHKYDPISQLDYYRFRALFEPHHVRLDPVPGETDLEKDGLPRVFDDQLEAATYLHRRGNPTDPDREHPIEPGVPTFFASFAPAIAPVELPFTAYTPGAREHVLRDHLQLAQQKLEGAGAKLAQAEAAAKEAEEVAVVAEVIQPPQNAAGGFALSDEFDAPDPERWRIDGDDWKYRDGALHKTASNRNNNVVALRQPPPRDFELVARYTTGPGDTFKSVGVRFDRIDGGENQHQVYTSAHAPDPKLQVMHTVAGKDQYPGAGYSSQPIKVGAELELKLAVRDRLLNVWLNGEFALAYNLPKRHPGGQIALSAFDCTAAFHSISIRALPSSFELQPGGDADDDAAGKLEVAAAELELARAELERVRAIAAAESVRDTGGEEFAQSATEAARAGSKVEIARGRLDLANAGGHQAKRKGARKAIAAAEEKLAGVVPGESEHEPLRVSRKALETPEHKFGDYPASFSATSSGRRLALARWVVDRRNPLTARVAVNHVWMRHFGEPLVESVADFGRRAEPPRHGELLDWLAAELIESGWSLKHLHRVLLNSEAFRMHSSNAGISESTRAADPTNALYWRMNARRMESQVVRDSLLHLAGVLDPQIGGASVDPKAGGVRRSLYFKHSRDDKDKFLSMFDDADRLACYRRAESIMPQQALALSNSKLALEMAAKIAARTSAEGGDFIGAAFETVLGRPPSAEGRVACRDFLAELEGLGVDTTTARARLVHALLNHNDFVTIR